MLRRLLCFLFGHRRGRLLSYRRLHGPPPWHGAKLEFCLCDRCGRSYPEFSYWETK